MSGKYETHDKDQAGDEFEESAVRLSKEMAEKYDPSRLSQLILRDAGRSEPLDLHTRSRMEQTLGGNFSNVRIIRGPLAEEITSRYRADAVTVSSTELILVREGWQSNFQSAEGMGLLAHELTHVQQGQRGLHFSGDHSPDSPLERQAYAVGAAVTSAMREGANAMKKDMRKIQSKIEHMLWTHVAKEAEKALKKGDTQDAVRDGSSNNQGVTR